MDRIIPISRLDITVVVDVVEVVVVDVVVDVVVVDVACNVVELVDDVVVDSVSFWTHPLINTPTIKTNKTMSLFTSPIFFY